MIAQFVRNNQKDWDVKLGEFRFALNTETHKSTSYTHAMLNFGRELQIPNSICGPLFESLSKEDPVELPAVHVQRMQEFKKLYETCHKNLTKLFSKQAKYYNLRRQDCKFQVGQLVWKRNFTLSLLADNFACKLAPKFIGPFKIKGFQGPNVAILNETNSNKTYTAHVKDLKVYKMGPCNKTVKSLRLVA